MSTDEQDPDAVPDGIHDTDDIRRIWDALEVLADKVDGTATAQQQSPPADHEGPTPTGT